MELRDLEGVGPATEAKLQAAGIETIEALAAIGSYDVAVEGLTAERVAELSALASTAQGAPVYPVEGAQQRCSPTPEDVEADEEEAALQQAQDTAQDAAPPRPGEFVAERPPYVRLTFLGMRDRRDEVGQLQIKGYLFDKDVAQNVPKPIADAILARDQYEFKVEEVGNANAF